VLHENTVQDRALGVPGPVRAGACRSHLSSVKRRWSSAPRLPDGLINRRRGRGPAGCRPDPRDGTRESCAHEERTGPRSRCEHRTPAASAAPSSCGRAPHAPHQQRATLRAARLPSRGTLRSPAAAAGRHVPRKSCSRRGVASSPPKWRTAAPSAGRRGPYQIATSRG
jgi:hypothetical protein